MKTPSDIQKVVKALPEEKRKKVEAIVRRHVEACRGIGVEVEYLDRVWIEAIEAVEVEEKAPELAFNESWPEYEPLRKYDVYDSPKGNW